MLHSLMAAGMDVTASRVTSILNLLDKHQVVLMNFSSFEKFGAVSDSSRMVSDYFTAMNDLTQWTMAVLKKKVPWWKWPS